MVRYESADHRGWCFHGWDRERFPGMRGGHVRRLMCICGDGVAESRAVGQGLLDMDLSPFLALIIHGQLFPLLGQIKNSTLPLFSDITPCAPQTGITQSCLPKKFPSYGLLGLELFLPNLFSSTNLYRGFAETAPFPLKTLIPEQG